MNQMPDKNSNRLDDLSQKLYSPNSPDIINKKTRPLSPLTQDVPRSWEEEVRNEEVVFEKPKYKGRGTWVFFTFALLFAAASFGFAWYYIVNKADVARKVDVTVTGPVSTPAGTPYPLEISIINVNSFDLELVDLIVEYPPGSKSADIPDRDIGTYREGLGTIRSGETVTRTISAVLFGESQQRQTIVVRAEYRIPNSNAIFDKEKVVDVLIESGPVEFDLDTLEEAIIGQETLLTLRVRSNTDAPITNMLIKAEYPQGFSFSSSQPDPMYADDTWHILVLEPRETREIHIRGTFSGEVGNEKFVRFTAGVPDQFDAKNIANIYASSLEKVSIVEPFLGAELVFDDGDIAEAGKIVKGSVVWKNNSGGPLTDVGIELTLSGSALNKRIITANKGFFRSTDNKIIWNKTTNPEFARIDDGQSGEVDFEFGVFGFDEYATLAKNPEVNLDLSLSARRPTQSGVPEEIRSSVTKKVKVATELAFHGRSVYYVGPFANSGPLPPMPETETTYTILWILTNESNDVTGAQVSAYLPPYIIWKDKVSPASDQVTFDETTRKILWNAGTIVAGTGSSRPSREVVFQVGLFPSTNQEGAVPALISDISFRGIDSSTGVEIGGVFADDITTRMTSDPNFTTAMEKVGGE